ncbi:MAG: SDR family oxidoreductase [Candidatus Solibacter sp.]|nr:SDR family oxidoreductase [Candidatus Solibacter sp.]
MVLVVGATGLVGSAVCEKLARQGRKVRALVRRTSSQERTAALQSCGVELCVGDLKDPDSIAAACRGVNAVISTASATLSRQAGDSIESVDATGQLSLVNTAKSCSVERFLFVSFRRSPALSFPLDDAKQAVEKAVTALNFTIIQASWFMEVWLSAALGFDYANATARIYGPGTAPISWVSFRDVAEMCAVALRHPAAERTTIEFGGPEALSPLEVVARFERIGGRPFQLEHIPEQVLRSQFEGATDSMQRSFAALMLGYLQGDAIDMAPVVETFGIKLGSVDDYARSVLAETAPTSARS